jgi:SOS-response transcriptional repressor LexA
MNNATRSMNEANGYAVKVEDDAMFPTLRKGDFVAVLGSLPDNGDICAAKHRADGWLFRRWTFDGKTVRLASDSPDAKSYAWTMEEFARERPLEWRGKVDALIMRTL